MPKGYWIAHSKVNDPDIYRNYVASPREAFAAQFATVLDCDGAFSDGFIDIELFGCSIT